MIEVVDRDDLAARNVAQLRPVTEKDGRRKLRQEGVRDVKVYVEPLQTREHVNLHLRKDLAAGCVLGMRQRRIWKGVESAHLFGRHRRKALPTDAAGQSHGR